MMPTHTVMRPIAVAIFSCGLAGIAGFTALHGEAFEIRATEATAEDTAQTQDSNLEQSVLQQIDDQPELEAPPVGLHNDPNTLYIKEIRTEGTGCRNPDAVTTQISDDGRTFLLLFNSMQLSYPPAPIVQNITCTAGISLHIPGGYQFALASVNTRGHIYLENNMRARQTSKYFFAGRPLAVAPRTEFVGPMNEDYDYFDEVEFESLVWSPCGGTQLFAIQSILHLNVSNNRRGSAVFSNDTIDGTFQQILHLQWRRC
jgi:hypothetical protein